MSALSSYYMKFRSYLEQSGQMTQKYPRLANVPLWLAAFATGIVSVLFAQAFKHAEILSLDLQKTPWFIIISPCCFILSWFLVYQFAPNARGSGIPQVMAAISLTDAKTGKNNYLQSLVGFKTILIKILSAIICVIGAGAIGREGPTIQVAAGIFFIIFLMVRSQFPKIDIGPWLIAGGGAGIAAAFNTPLGGLVYAIEELATKHFSQFRTTLISAVMISGLAALWLAGNYLYFGESNLKEVTIVEQGYAILLGIIAGGMGGLFGKALYYTNQFRKKLKSPLLLTILAATCGLVMVIMIYGLRPEAAGSGRELVVSLLNGKATATLPLTLARWLSPVISNLGGAAGGIFAPSLAAGASIGSLVSQIVGSVHVTFFIIMCMIGFLTGMTHAPFTSMVLVLEMTDRHSLILPMMLCTFSAYAITSWISHKSFYELMRDEFYETFRAT